MEKDGFARSKFGLGRIKNGQQVWDKTGRQGARKYRHVMMDISFGELSILVQSSSLELQV